MKLKPRVLISSRFREDSSQNSEYYDQIIIHADPIVTAGKEASLTSWRQSNREHAEAHVSGETTWMHAGLEACTCSWTHAHRTASQHVDAANVHVSLHACMPLCMRARGTCIRARRCACVHKAHACLLAVVHACTRHMHACSSTCMRARGTCARARRYACVHDAHARVLVDMHACTRHMHACSRMCARAKPRAGLHG